MTDFLAARQHPMARLVAENRGVMNALKAFMEGRFEDVHGPLQMEADQGKVDELIALASENGLLCNQERSPDGNQQVTFLMRDRERRLLLKLR